MNLFLISPWPYLATAAFAALIGWYVWMRPHRPGTQFFRWLVGVWLLWACAAALQTVVSSPGLQFGLWVLQSVCALLGITFQLLVVLEFTGGEKWLARRNILLLLLPPFLLVLMTIVLPDALSSTDIHSGFEVLGASNLMKGSFIAYAFVLILVALEVLFTNLLRTPGSRLPILLIFLGQFLTTLGYVVIFPRPLPVSPIQASVLLINFLMLTYFVALYSFRLLRVIPVARDVIVSHMDYGLIVLDAENYLVDFNPAAQILPGLPGKLVLRQSAEKALGDWWGRISPLIGDKLAAQDVKVPTISGKQVFKVHGLPLLQPSGWRMGQAFILEDVTQLHQSQQQQAQTLWAKATLQEREQLADDLHDGLSQNLAFLNLQAQAAQVYLLAGQADTAQASLVRLIEAAGEIQEDARELIDHLLSVSLPSENFRTTLRRILADFERQTGLAAHLVIDGQAAAEDYFDPSLLPPPLAVQLVRISQEALTNVRKHARGASQVNVALNRMDGRMVLSIQDDGQGFDPEDTAPIGKHFGLRVMRQRTARIGGQVEIHSAPGRGTRIQVSVPLAQPELEGLV